MESFPLIAPACMCIPMGAWERAKLDTDRAVSVLPWPLQEESHSGVRLVQSWQKPQHRARSLSLTFAQAAGYPHLSPAVCPSVSLLTSLDFFFPLLNGDGKSPCCLPY